MTDQEMMEKMREFVTSLEVLTKAQALEWCEGHDVSVEVIAKNFEVQEG